MRQPPGRRRLWWLAAASLAVAGCAATDPRPDPRPDPRADAPTRVPSRLVEQAPSTAPTAPSASPDPVAPALPPDPRWRFFEADRTRYASPWFPGRHRVMIGYGCTEAPYYVPDARCAGGGFHHGIDVAIPCGTPLHSAVEGRVVTPAPGTVGPAYGERPLLLRADVGGRPADILLGHARRLLVQPGDRVSPGDRVALNGASAGPDGCHLHLEVRAPGGDVTTARDPGPVLRLRRPGRPQTASIGG